MGLGIPVEKAEFAWAPRVRIVSTISQNQMQLTELKTFSPDSFVGRKKPLSADVLFMGEKQSAEQCVLCAVICVSKEQTYL